MNRLSWIFIIGTVVVLAAFGFFYLKPQITKTWKAFQETNKANADLNDVAKEKEILSNLSKNNQLSSLYDITSKYIPEEEQSGELVIELTAIANQSNLKVTEISFESAVAPTATKQDEQTSTTKTQNQTNQNNQATSEAKSDKINEVSFTLKLTGSFSDYLAFLKNIETSSRLITITAMTLNQGPDGFSAQLTGKAYWKKGSSLEKNLANIEISQETIKKFQNLKTYGSPINLPAESGFGRQDPFAAPK